MRESEKKIARIAGVRYVPVDHPIPKKPKVHIHYFHDTTNRQRSLISVHHRSNEEWPMETTCRVMGHVVFHRRTINKRKNISRFTAATSAYATDLASNRLSGNLYLNQFLFGLVLYVSKVVSNIRAYFISI